MKKVFLFLSIVTFLFAGDKFYGVELGVKMPKDFEYADKKARNDYKYMKTAEAPFDSIYVKVNSSKLVTGVMLIKENQDDNENEKFFAMINNKLSSKYGTFTCTEGFLKAIRAKQQKCMGRYKNNSITSIYTSSGNAYGIAIDSAVFVEYENVSNASNLDKL